MQLVRNKKSINGVMLGARACGKQIKKERQSQLSQTADKPLDADLGV